MSLNNGAPPAGCMGEYPAHCPFPSGRPQDGQVPRHDTSFQHDHATAFSQHDGHGTHAAAKRGENGAASKAVNHYDMTGAHPFPPRYSSPSPASTAPSFIHSFGPSGPITPKSSISSFQTNPGPFSSPAMDPCRGRETPSPQLITSRAQSPSLGTHFRPLSPAPGPVRNIRPNSPRIHRSQSPFAPPRTQSPRSGFKTQPPRSRPQSPAIGSRSQALLNGLIGQAARPASRGHGPVPANVDQAFRHPLCQMEPWPVGGYEGPNTSAEEPSPQYNKDGQLGVLQAYLPMDTSMHLYAPNVSDEHPRPHAGSTSPPCPETTAQQDEDMM